MHPLIKPERQFYLDHDTEAEPIGDPEIYDSAAGMAADGGASAEEPAE